MTQIDEMEEGKRALQFLQMQGYRKCSIAACNCPFWHGGNASDRLKEIHDILNDAGCEPYRKTAIKAIEELIESARTPRTISREEFERVVQERQSYLMRQKDSLRNIVPIEQEAMQAALATLGITVEGE